MMSSIPKFFAINDRPVKVVKNAAGGWSAFALDMSTGDWVDGEAHLDRWWRHDGDIDLYTEEEFNARVAEVRKATFRVMPEPSELPQGEE
jgi:hypothetical protein